MSQLTITEYKKVDYSFYKGYQFFRNAIRKDLVIHILQLVILIIFLPIDIHLLESGHLVIPAISVSIGLSTICIITLTIKYCILFNKYGLLGFVQLAQDTLHATDQAITSATSELSCTSQVMLHQPTGSLKEGVSQKTIEVFGNIAKFEIDRTCDQKHASLECWSRIQYFSGVTSIIVVTALMIASDHLNAAQIVILVLYILLQVYCRWIFVLIAFLVAISPIILIVFCFWICCCKPKQGVNKLDLKEKNATAEDIVLCDGECAICLMMIDPGEKIYGLPCSVKHIFHKRCLDKWADVKLTCPTCRKELPFKNMVLQQGQGIQIQNG